jgi:serine/threonine-protein kinase RsbT
MTTLSESLVSGVVTIELEGDIVAARRAVREVATQLGFTQSDVVRIVTAASELARNIYRFAGEGFMRWTRVEKDGRVGIELQFCDKGPGISDVGLALNEGFSTGGGLGMGLPGARKLADELEVDSAVGRGTIVTLRKWRRN